MQFDIPVPPTVNTYWRMFLIGGRPRMILSKAARAYKKTVAAHALFADLGEPLKGPIVVSLTVYRARKVGDLDNFSKGALDSLKGIAFEDDSQIVELHLFRRDDKDKPRVTVRVEQVYDKPQENVA